MQEVMRGESGGITLPDIHAQTTTADTFRKSQRAK